MFDGISATTYLLTLTTFMLSGTYSASMSVLETTYPAAVTSVTLLDITSTSFLFSFEASFGADIYSYTLFDQESGSFFCLSILVFSEVDTPFLLLL